MKKRLLSAFLLAMTLFTTSSYAQKIVAYYPYYRSTAANLPYSKFTDIFYGFIGTDGQGHLTATAQGDNWQNYTCFEQAEWNTLRGAAIANGVNVHIAVGGANLTNHLAASAGSSYRSTLVSEIVNFVSGNHSLNNVRIKGVDIDWEFPKTTQAIADHLALCAALRTALDAQGTTDGVHYELSIAVGGSSRNMPGLFAEYHDDFFDTDCFQYIDFLNCMNYDLVYVTGYGSHNSPYAAAAAVVDRYVTNGINGVALPAEKFVLGVPFYGKTTSDAAADYNTFSNASSYDDADGVYNGYSFNSRPLLEQKADLICQKGLAGFLIWEVTQDDPSYSLLDAMNDRFAASCASFSCNTPDLGNDQTYCSTPITLDINVTLDNGESVKWYKDNVELTGETGTTLVVSAAGKYKAEIYTSQGCTKYDEVTITQGGNLQAEISNLGYFCGSIPSHSSVDVTITGGGGFYEIYDQSTGGNLLATSTGTWTVNSSFIANDETSKTFYIEEPAGQTGTVGRTASLATNDSWSHPDLLITPTYYQDFRIDFTTMSALKIVSVEVGLVRTPEDPAVTRTWDNDNIEIVVYNETGTTVISSVNIPIDGTMGNYSDVGLVSIPVNIELATAGNYQIGLGSATSIGVLFERDWALDAADYPAWPYVGQIDGTTVITLNSLSNDDYPWDISTNYLGLYNWTVSTGVGGQSCGRVNVTAHHDCPTVTGVNDIAINEVAVYPNPATANVNVEFNLVEGNNVSVQLINALGEVVMVQNAGNLAAGANLVNFDASTLENGVYFVKIQAGTESLTQSLTIVK